MFTTTEQTIGQVPTMESYLKKIEFIQDFLVAINILRKVGIVTSPTADCIRNCILFLKDLHTNEKQSSPFGL